MHPVKNDTKWGELRLGMYGLGRRSPLFRLYRNLNTCLSKP